ncbi:TIGR02594 family protein [Bradyrhizobium sp. ORS 86]|uniref:TIGR02594 family protein n=1 Tax=Bradyrhizobium sp. ORS 86 TaxID=1685970 RepID=UPI0038904939
MAEFFAAVPWLVLLVVIIREAIQQWMIIRSLDKALERAQCTVPAAPAVTPAQPAPPVTAPAKPAPAPAAPQPAAPAGPFADYPAWYQEALKEIGFHETGNNQGIEKYIALSHCGAAGDPWCAIFANAMLERAGIAGTRSAASQSFRTDPNFVQLSGPAKGAIVVYWRISKASGQGHVGFYRGEDASQIWTLGGNENDMVQIEALPKDSPSFGLVGYFWPKSAALPAIGAVMMPAGSSTSMQTAAAAGAAPAAVNAKQTGITATVFGGQQSAYGGAIDDNTPGVALPYRFSGARPRVRVTNAATKAFIDCDIVDVGPWNTKDPYWQTGSRPQAESGIDLTGRKTNKAGIDLTIAAANAIQIDGKGLVDWEFLQSPAQASPSPNVV